jgi:hypothetical protein
MADGKTEEQQAGEAGAQIGAEAQIDLTVIKVDNPSELPGLFRPLEEIPEQGVVHVYTGTPIGGRPWRIIAVEVFEQEDK